MTAVTLTAFTTEGSITWNRTVDVSTLDPANFVALPGGQTAVTLTQNGANGALVEYDDVVETSNSVRYNGHNTNFLTPQTLHV
jgi:hypothetical protein